MVPLRGLKMFLGTDSLLLNGRDEVELRIFDGHEEGCC